MKNHRVLFERESDDLKLLLKLHNENPQNAYVYFKNKGKVFYRTRLVLHEDGDDFAFVLYSKSVGISTTRKIYSREKVDSKLSYSKNKFWFVNNSNKITPLTYSGVVQFLYGIISNNFDFVDPEIEKWHTKLNVDFFNATKYAFKFLSKVRRNKFVSNRVPEFIIDYIITKFSWVRFVLEEEISFTTFNYIVSHKLYNLRDLLRACYKVSWPVISDVILVYKAEFSTYPNKPQWLNMLKHVINPESLTFELFSHHNFNDAIRMADMLGKKVNCKWGVNRLTDEHDKMSREISIVMFSFRENRNLKILKAFRQFGLFSKYKLLDTSLDVLKEGFVQQHCVGTYINKVENGQCAIFHVEGFTLELMVKRSHDKKYIEGDLYIAQFRGLRNSVAPEELMNRVEAMIHKYNLNYNPKRNKNPKPNKIGDIMSNILNIPDEYTLHAPVDDFLDDDFIQLWAAD